MASNWSGTSHTAYVLSLAEVVEIVLSFLPERALSQAAQVCRLWHDTARRISRPRQKWLSYLVHHGNNRPCTSKVGLIINQ